MKKFLTCILPAVTLLFASSLAGHAGTTTPKQQPAQDQFAQIQNSPNGYWVPANTPPPPVAYYYGGPPPPYYYGPYGPGPYYGPRYYGPRGPHVFLGFGFHVH